MQHSLTYLLLSLSLCIVQLSEAGTLSVGFAPCIVQLSRAGRDSFGVTDSSDGVTDSSDAAADAGCSSIFSSILKDSKSFRGPVTGCHTS